MRTTCTCIFQIESEGNEEEGEAGLFSEIKILYFRTPLLILIQFGRGGDFNSCIWMDTPKLPAHLTNYRASYPNGQNFYMSPPCKRRILLGSRLPKF